MSNRAIIQQQTTTIRKTGLTTKDVVIFDDYDSGHICLDDYSDNFYDDDMELLAFILDIAKEDESLSVKSVLDSVLESETGIEIEGTWYGWEQIKSVFEKYQ